MRLSEIGLHRSPVIRGLSRVGCIPASIDEHRALSRARGYGFQPWEFPGTGSYLRRVCQFLDVESCSGTMSPGYLEESTVSKQRVPTLVLPALAICFLVCRLISRRLKRLPLGVDDYTLILGQVGRAIDVQACLLTLFRSLLYPLQESIMLVCIYLSLYSYY